MRVQTTPEVVLHQGIAAALQTPNPPDPSDSNQNRGGPTADRDGELGGQTADR